LSAKSATTRVALRDRADPNLVHDEIATIDHALTRPCDPDPRPGLRGIVIANENYFLSAEGMLMPAKEIRRSPDLQWFKQTGRRIRAD
jgi:hypothetical protein